MAQLRRDLGFWAMAALGISMMLGSGIFFGPALTAQEFPDWRTILGLWLVGGLVAITGAWVFGRLAARRPLSGGPYVYMRDAYGELPAFLFAWTSLVIIAPTSMAVIATLFAQSLAALLPALAGIVKPVALAVIGLFALVNLVGVKSGGRVQTALSAFKVLLVVGFLAALLVGIRAAAPTSAVAGGGRWSVAFVGILFAYGGWEYAVLASEEVRDASKNIPRGLVTGALVVTALYVAAVWVYLLALGASGVAQSTALAPEAARRVAPALGNLIALAIVVSTAGTINAITLLGPRATFAAARDGLVPGFLGAVSERSGVPSASIVLQAALAAVYLLTGAFATVAAYTVVGVGTFIVPCALALLRDRTRGWVGAAEVAAVLVVAGVYAWFLVRLVVEDPATALVGLGLIAVGVLPYAAMKWRARTQRIHA